MRCTAIPEVDIRTVSIAELQQHGIGLFLMAWRETGGETQLDIDWDQYLGVESMGLLTAWAAWRGGTMVGYSVMVVLPSMHSRIMVAESLALFVHPEHRRGGLGMRLIRLTEASANESGAELRWRSKSGQALDRLLPRMGYVPMDEICYVKEKSQ